MPSPSTSSPSPSTSPSRPLGRHNATRPPWAAIARVTLHLPSFPDAPSSPPTYSLSPHTELNVPPLSPAVPLIDTASPAALASLDPCTWALFHTLSNGIGRNAHSTRTLETPILRLADFSPSLSLHPSLGQRLSPPMTPIKPFFALQPTPPPGSPVSRHCPLRRTLDHHLLSHHSTPPCPLYPCRLPLHRTAGATNYYSLVPGICLAAIRARGGEHPPPPSKRPGASLKPPYQHICFALVAPGRC